MLLGSLFEDIKKHFYLSEFKDDVTDSFFDIKPSSKLNIIRRCSCSSLKWRIEKERIIFNVLTDAIPNSLSGDYDHGVDIFVKRDCKTYVLPSEILDENYSISVYELEVFAMKGKSEDKI